jgi:hypothetical protein
VEWRGRLTNLTHTQCVECGGINCQVWDEGGSGFEMLEAEGIDVGCSKAGEDALKEAYAKWLESRPHWHGSFCFEAYCAGRLDEKTEGNDRFNNHTAEVGDWLMEMNARLGLPPEGMAKDIIPKLEELQAALRQATTRHELGLDLIFIRIGGFCYPDTDFRAAPELEMLLRCREPKIPGNRPHGELEEPER